MLLFLQTVILFACADYPAFAADTKAARPLNASWTPDPVVTAQLASDPTLFSCKLDASMRKLLHDPATMTIELTPINASESSVGHFQKITVKVARGEADQLILEHADTEFIDVQLDTTKLVKEDKVDTVKVTSINMDVTILESDLNTFLLAKCKAINVDNPKIEMGTGTLTLSGSTKYSFMKVKFWATGQLSVHDEKAIWFHPKKIKLNGMGMPRAFIGNIVKRINPVLNLEKFPFQLNLKTILVEPGILHLSSFRS
ncbi:MAG: DUF2993 domain-containing protein [Candidatus Riflebacteria bacterium]|nr:DUF2993 domain-containing protein [Candidatus Riflebacteria bacterium]